MQPHAGRQLAQGGNPIDAWRESDRWAEVARHARLPGAGDKAVRDITTDDVVRVLTVLLFTVGLV